MITLKLGSQGVEVGALQRYLGLYDDYVFGPKTEAVLKKWQSDNGLTPDGIAGPKTLAKMGLSENPVLTKCVDASVIYKPLSVHVSKLTKRSIKYIAIHYTAGGSSSSGRALSIYNIFQKREASADFAVDDLQIVQFNPDLNNYYCWAVGDKKNPYSKGGSLNGLAYNRNTISIEICSNLEKGTSSSAANHEGWYFTKESLDNARKLVRILMKKFNIPIDRVVRHYDITGKLCPGVIGWNNEAIYDKTGKKTTKKNNSDTWLEFKNSI